jgi:hypothetical protein
VNVATDDGGATWHTVPAPGPAYAANGGSIPGSVSDLRFANPEVGWAFGPGLHVTFDGGQRWTAPDLGGFVASLEPGLDTVYALVFPGSFPPTCGTTDPSSRRTRVKVQPVLEQSQAMTPNAPVHREHLMEWTTVEPFGPRRPHNQTAMA